MSRNSPDSRSPTSRNEPHVKPGLRKNLPHKTASVFTTRNVTRDNKFRHSSVGVTNQVKSDGLRSSEESYLEFRDEGTSPVNFDNVSQKSLSLSQLDGFKPLFTSGTNSKRNQINLNQPPIPEIRIGKEPDKSKEKSVNKSKRMYQNDD